MLKDFRLPEQKLEAIFVIGFLLIIFTGIVGLIIIESIKAANPTPKIQAQSEFKRGE